MKERNVIRIGNTIIDLNEIIFAYHDNWESEDLDMKRNELIIIFKSGIKIEHMDTDNNENLFRQIDIHLRAMK